MQDNSCNHDRSAALVEGRSVNTTVDPSVDAAAKSAALIEVRLSDIQQAARDTNTYELRRPDGGTLPSAGPGAHIDLHCPTAWCGNTRSPLCEPDPTRYVVGVKRDAASRGGSTFIHDQLKVGAAVQDPSAAQPLSAGRNCRAYDPDRRRDRHHADLVHGAAAGRAGKIRGSSTIRAARAPTRRFSPLQEYDQVHFHFDEESDGIFLDLDGIVAAAPKNAHLYCCGPLPMLKAFEAAAASWPRQQIHVEYFIPKHEAAFGRRLHGRACPLGAGIFHSGGQENSGSPAR